MILFLALALALLIGISLGLLGGGGSILTVPILVYALGVEPKSAIAMSLFVVGITSVAALIPHARAGRVHFRTGIIFGLAGMVGAYLAGLVAHYIPAGILLVAFAGMMLVTAVAMLRGRKTPAGGEASDDGEKRQLPTGKILAEGLVVGAVTGLVGAGGGFLVVPALVLLGGLPMTTAVGTSLVVIAMKSAAGFVGYLGHVEVDFQLASIVAASAVVGSVIGGKLASRVSQEALRKGFGWFVVAMGVFMMSRQLPEVLGITVDWARIAPIALPYALLLVATPVAYRLGKARCSRTQRDAGNGDALAAT